MIKYYAWEKPFMKKVEDTRNKEVLYGSQSQCQLTSLHIFLHQVGCIINYHYMLSGLNVTYTVVSIVPGMCLFA